MASGDVVNTAARLQSAAPVNGILVDETTYRATRAAVDYEEAELRRGEGEGGADPRLDGGRSALALRRRRRARGTLRARRARARARRRQRRLRASAARAHAAAPHARRRPRHRQEPPRLRAPAASSTPTPSSSPGARDAASPTATASRCGHSARSSRRRPASSSRTRRRRSRRRSTRSVEDTLAGTGDEARVEAHLLALLGLAGETQLGGDRRNEAFAAWRRFLEGLAEQRPLVVVVEDIHWADESLLDFLDELVDWLTDVPLLVVATARPELLERRPGWGGGKLNATTLALSPLSDEQTAELIGQLARPTAARGRRTADAARASRRQSALRRAVRRALHGAGLDRRARAAGDAPGHHRRTSRRASRLGEEPPPGRSSRRQGVLGELDRPRPGRRDRLAPLTRAQGLRPPPAPLVTRR